MPTGIELYRFSKKLSSGLICRSCVILFFAFRSIKYCLYREHVAYTFEFYLSRQS